MNVSIARITTLARGGDDLVRGWCVEVSRLGRELFSFVITRDLQLWNATKWWADRGPGWWRTWWAP